MTTLPEPSPPDGAAPPPRGRDVGAASSPGGVGGCGVVGLLEPGSTTGYEVAGDEAVLAAMVRAELAWLEVLVAADVAPSGIDAQLERSLATTPLDLGSIAARGREGGNPVIPLVDDLRARLGDSGHHLHRGLTSQDVLDSAVVLVAGAALDHLAAGLQRVGAAAAAQAQMHRDTVMVGRTLTQHAAPLTFGLKAAQWLISVHEVLEQVEQVRGELPVQCGGAVGTLAGAEVVAGSDPLRLAQAWADLLDLQWPGAPWHTRRRPITRIGDALAATVSTLGHLGSDLVSLARSEVAEVTLGLAPGDGRSSTMPHKRNPVGAVLLRSAGLQAGPMAGLLHQCAALAVDERPDGAWHAEWPTLQRLLMLGVSSAEQAATVLEGLVVHADVMAAHVQATEETLLSEQRCLTPAASASTTSTAAAGPDPSAARGAAGYLGAAAAMTDHAVRAWHERETR